MPKKTLFILILIIIAGAMAGLWYWKYFKSDVVDPGQEFVPGENPTGFTPLNPNQPNTNNPGTNTNNPSTTTTSNNQGPEENIPKEKLTKIFNTPVSFGLFASSSASSSFVYFTDRGVGHTYIADMLLGSSTKITNTTIPRIYETYWGRNGEKAVFRYIKEDSETVSAFISNTKTQSSSTPGSLKASYLSDSLIAVSYSPTKDRIFIIEKSGSGAIGYILNSEGLNKTKIFESPLTYWKADWAEANTILLTTNSSKKVYGYAYTLNPNTGALKKILGPEYGLSVKISPDAKTVLYTTVKNNVVTTKLKTLSDNTTIETYFKTHTDKCVWGIREKQYIYCAVTNDLGANFPDDWYKGKTYYTDTVWRLNSVSGELTKITDLYKEKGELIDVIDPVLDRKDDYLFFINRNDLTLWALDL